MAQKVKLLFLVANLVFVRLALASVGPSDSSQTGSSHQDQTAQFDRINSLDFAPNEQTINATSGAASATIHHEAGLHVGGAGPTSSHRAQPEAVPAPQERPRVRGGKSVMGAATVKRHAVPSTIPQLLISLLGQLEKVDVKRIIMDSIAQMRSGSDVVPSAVGQRQTKRRSTKPDQDAQATSTSGATNQTTKSSPSKERTDAGSLAGDAGNLLSITKQLVKLARGQVMGGAGAEFGSPSSWFGPAGLGMMSGAGGGHFGGLDSAGHDFTAAGFKSDWFWLAVPAVIVIGAGVIVVPLIAAWLVSQMMGHNTFTVSAGRRRRRRDVNSTQASDPMAFESTHKDLFSMLDIHRFLDDPQFLVEKLDKFQKALDSAGSSFIKSDRKQL